MSASAVNRRAALAIFGDEHPAEHVGAGLGEVHAVPPLWIEERHRGLNVEHLHLPRACCGHCAEQCIQRVDAPVSMSR